MLKITEVADKAEYWQREKQMTNYPEVFKPGTCIYRRRVNAREVVYNMILPDGRLMFGRIPFHELRRGTTPEMRLQFLFDLQGND